MTKCSKEDIKDLGNIYRSLKKRIENVPYKLRL